MECKDELDRDPDVQQYSFLGKKANNSLDLFKDNGFF